MLLLLRKYYGGENSGLLVAGDRNLVSEYRVFDVHGSARFVFILYIETKLGAVR